MLLLLGVKPKDVVSAGEPCMLLLLGVKMWPQRCN
jgi:hypothetical protein